VQRSSASIAALASALAKAQIELANPEKSLVGTIEPQRGEGGARQFRYAPLSSGLEIVRKTLGQHEIATVQTTAIDQAAGIVNLTTLLAHSSGEWIASDWPVCAVSETAKPHRMGAALTYARRYALFTLVGIAGEDDLDAPDLIGPVPQTEKLSIESKPAGNGGQPMSSNHKAGRARANKFNSPSPKSELSAALSASLRTELLREIEGLSAADNAALWAQRRLPAKNQLSAADARQVEEAFAAQLALISAENPKQEDANNEIGDVSSAERRPGQFKSTRGCLFSPNRVALGTVTMSACDEATVPGVRSAAVGSSSFTVRTISCPWSQGERRIYGAALSRASP
jgi:hypothetical protein